MKISFGMKMVILAAIPLLFYTFTGLYLLGEQRKVFDDLSSSIYETTNQANTFLLNADRDLYQSYMAYALMESGELDAAAFAAAKEEMAANKDQALKRVASAKAILESSGLLSVAIGESGKESGEIFEQFDTSFGEWYKEAAKSVDDGKAQVLNAKIDGQFQSARGGVDEVVHSVDLYAGEKMAEIESRLDETQLSTFIGIIVVTMLLLIMVTFMTRAITRTIKSVLDKTKRVSEGDLTSPRAERYGKDELGHILRSVDDMIDRMNTLISGVVSSSTQVKTSSSRLSIASSESAAASEHVAKQIMEVSQHAEAQARSAEETSRAIEEMAVGIGRIAENTSTMADHSMSTSSEAAEGQLALGRLDEQMAGLGDVIKHLSGIIATLENRSEQIGSIAENITTFAGQTNILSLNASIEAARAGEHGKGFAVVAGEIRKLAAGSLASAEGINKLVNETRGEIASASAAMRQTLREVDEGSERVNELKRRLNAIGAAVNLMAEQLQESSAITEQMSASSEQVSATTEQTAATAGASLEKAENVAAATEEQLALMDNIASASRTLDEIVDQLGSAVGHFKVKG
ncbi:HAMP domain-containing methyl-accepting chemotaxis protein [Paenibacillus sp. LHD-117]|uniref:methyl-accepting chemotaxis protein n=1 Tax=Paenibacillus sp. LHD-117 TaxID=3071412 RepID=UPI0027E0B32D|nr:HAMP domain-containing methyl-accepting chemotaxis protein [Paenibacillus sp. LHD-117]MDQ6420909.1 HAMP domain-containing methyl-accepting chemotaxis protein [Paenibacillus sp. LHD-117]